MNLTQIYLDTFIPEYPKIINGNFASTSRYIDVFYDGSLGILTKPLTTTGKVKGAKGEFVTVVVDNLVVKNQFTNLFDNNTTADYNFYKLYLDPAVQPRDACLGPGYWPKEYSFDKYVDVNKPYYKIQNQTEPYVFVNSNLSQVIGIFLDPSLINGPSTKFQVVLNPDPSNAAWFIADSSAAGDPSMGTGFYVEFIAVAYDPSWGTTWAQYKHGLPVVGTGGGSGGSGTVGPGTPGNIPLFNTFTSIIDSPLSILGSTLNTFAQNVDGVITLTNKKVTGVATPTNPTDAVNLDFTGQFTTNSSANIALTQFIRSTSTGFGLYWNAGALDVSVNLVGISESQMRAYVDPSLALKANNASLGLYATNASIGLAGFAKNASLGLYATNASVGLALAPYATNASVGLALASYATNSSVNAAGFAKQVYVDGSLAQRDASILWLQNNTLNSAALNPYATNASIGLAGFLKNVDISSFATNVSVGLAIAPFATNASVNTAFTQFIRSTSTGVTLYWHGGTLDVSVVPSAGPSFAYVDGSLGLRDTSIAWLFANKLGPADLAAYLTPYATLTYVNNNFATNVSVNNAFFNYYTSAQVDALLLNYVSQAYVDGSLNDLELQILSLDNRVTILETSTGNCTFAYVDGSLFTRDSSIILLFSRLNTTDTSLALLTLNWEITDASLAVLTVNSLNFATNASVNAAGFAKNSSVNFLYGWQLSQDASIASLRGNISTINGQIGSLNTRMTNTEASVNRLDSSVNWLMQQTSGEITTLYFHNYVDGSLNARDLLIEDLYSLDFIRSSSTGNGLFWNASTNLLDVSVAGGGGGVSQAYVDGSLAVLRAMDASLDASINLLFGWQLSQDDSINSLRAIDASLDASISALDILTQKHDISIGALILDVAEVSTRVFHAESSLNDVIDIYAILDASLSVIIGDISNIDISISALDILTQKHDASIGSIMSSLDTYATNSSVGIALDQFIRSSSLGTGLFWDVSGYFDVSNGISGTVNFIPEFNNLGTGIINSSIYAIGSTLLNVGGNFTLSASEDIILKSSRMDSAGNVILVPSNSGNPGFDGQIWLGDDAFDSYAIDLQARSFNPNIELRIWQKGLSQLTLGNSVGPVKIDAPNIYLANSLAVNLGKIYMYGIDSSTRNKILYYDSDASTVGFGDIPSSTLSTLTDVSISVLTDHNLLQYDSSSAKWLNVAPVDASLYFQQKITNSTPGGSGAAGTAGNWSYDTSYLYICTSTNKWGRVLLDYAF